MKEALSSTTAAGGACVDIVPVMACHRPGWCDLWRGFALALDTPLTEEATAETWKWLCDPAHPLEGIIAVGSGGRPVGLAHFHSMPSPLLGREAGYLADLFVDPAFRGQGIGRALFEAVMAIGRGRGWSRVRWVTPESNRDAIDLYDRIATRVPVIAYDFGL